MKSCDHIKADGRPCNAPALRKHSYCFFHQQQINRRHREYPDRLPILEDRAAVQVAIMQVLDRLYLKTIDYKAAALMLYGLQLASTNLKGGIFEGKFGKVDRYYGNANETEQPVAPPKPAPGLSPSVSSADSSNPGVPEAPHECSPARSAGFQGHETDPLPEERLKTTSDPNQPQPRKFSFTLPPGVKCPPERLQELERIYAKYGTQIKACAEDALDAYHSERSEESLSSPDTLPGVGIYGCVANPERSEGPRSQLTTRYSRLVFHNSQPLASRTLSPSRVDTLE